ncbi:hypothetical protein OB2597_00680 [Pseudooceanicola batsensis HTCC2597]|uniref:ABC phosphate/phosphonate transporter, periplasmic ligand binding protein n=1 Tax=Pseudooceanicola batsensis (strain ATCC BAA-863 / DSM 15984 / KCTC 12145 / HTCC2597) TaxID=252305 RepID=A3U1V3_PSEBH|nr:PhnD/SsuA/transferrin family substrate-binding protein [Pseudooceanicola batsensis]EAQ01887.1 hypothetical protein OB2597_00680 [Pseudooceanicola batsensis HTCC2597]
MIASLPMYDRPETAGANDRFWDGVREHLAERGIAAPERLSRGEDLWSCWENPDLFLSQTCGLPYRSRLHGKVRIVGTPDYRLEGCPPGHYASWMIVRADDDRTEPHHWREKRFVFNEARSQSGWAGPLAHALRLGSGFASMRESGSHVASARAVAEGEADIAGIDAQTWRMIEACDPWADRLRRIGTTPPTPGLPFITGPHTPPETVAALRAAIGAAIAALSAGDRAVLHLHDIVTIDAADYLAVPTPQA